MIKAVIFDIDGVLINSFEANFKFYQDLMAFAGYKRPTRDLIASMFHMTMEDVIRKLIGNKDDDEVHRVWLLGKKRAVRYPYELVSSPENCKDVLIELSKKYVLAIVTSRIKGGVFSLRQLSELESLFKVSVYFEDTVKHKPEPDPLIYACHRLDIEPDEAVYIGDTDTDVKAAKSAGMKVIIFSNTDITGADARTNLFTRIPVLVDRI